MELYLFNEKLEYITVIDQYLSIRWHRRFYTTGEFEVHIPYSEKIINKLKFDYIIGRRDAVEAGIIESIAITDDKDSSEKIIIKGRFLTVLLARRCLVGTWFLSDTIENEMHRIVNLNCIAPTDPARVIPLLEINSPNGYPKTINSQVTDKELLEQLSTMSKDSDIGFRITPNYNNKKMYFETYTGIDYSKEQLVNPHRIFSDDFENLQNANYDANNILAKNTAYVAGDGEGDARKRITIVGATGLLRREICVDARDLSSKDISESIYIEQLTQRGKEKLSECISYEQFEADINPRGNYRYKTHWDLGDIVTVIKKRWNIIINQRITEVTEVFENDDVTITPIFGTSLPNKK